MRTVKKLCPLLSLSWVIFLSIAQSNTCIAQTCKIDSGFWHDYSGKLDKHDIQLSVFTNSDGSVIGNYRFSEDEKNVFSVKGKQEDCIFSLTGYNNKNEEAARFTVTKYPDYLEGKYQRANDSITNVKLRATSIVGGSPVQRYLELFGTTGEVEVFAEEIKNAFIKSNKNWLAKKCIYPLTVYPEKGKEKIIKTEKDFLDNYTKLFSKAFQEKFKKIKCHNMFSNHMGAFMGKGEVVMNHTKNSSAEKYEYGITSITVFF